MDVNVLKSAILEAVREDAGFRVELMQELFPQGVLVSFEDVTDVFESECVSLKVGVDLGYFDLRDSASATFGIKKYS